ALRTTEASKVPNPIRTNLDYGERNKLEDDDEDLTVDTAAYCDSKKNRDYWEEAGDSPAAKDFQKYIKDVKCTSLPILQKNAIIRGQGVRECPFGLPISMACKNAGDAVDRMTPLTDSNKEDWNRLRKINRRVYVFHQSGQRCVYADKIVDGKN